MRWTCPKCGKKLDISNEQLIANDGVIVCPQCLLQAHQPIPKARITPKRQDPSSTSSRRKPQRPITFDSDTPPEYRPATPPPHKSSMKQPSPPRRHAAPTGNGTAAPLTGTPRENVKRPTSKKKKRKRRNGMSAWGCLGRTVAFTLVLFAAYVFFGLLLEAIQ